MSNVKNENSKYELLKAQLYNKIVSDSLFEKYMSFKPWTIKKEFVLYPIMFCSKFLEVNVKSKVNYFNKAIERIINENPDLFAKGEFIKDLKNDIYCVRFYYTEDFIKNMKEIKKA